MVHCPLHHPTQVAIWTRYAELEITAGPAANVKAIFSRCLLSCPNVDLWYAYLRFIKKVRPHTCEAASWGSYCFLLQ